MCHNRTNFDLIKHSPRNGASRKNIAEYSLFFYGYFDFIQTLLFKRRAGISSVFCFWVSFF